MNSGLVHNTNEKFFHKAKWDNSVVQYAALPQRLNFLTLVNSNCCCSPCHWVCLVFDSLCLRIIDLKKWNNFDLTHVWTCTILQQQWEVLWNVFMLLIKMWREKDKEEKHIWNSHHPIVILTLFFLRLPWVFQGLLSLPVLPLRNVNVTAASLSLVFPLTVLPFA